MSKKNGNRERAEPGWMRLGGRKPREAPIDRQCGNCNAPIRVYAYLLREYNYCNRECFQEHRTKRAGCRTECEVCGGRIPNRNRERRFCSRECYQTTQRGHTLVPLTCKECGSGFTRRLQVTRADARKTGLGYCSTVCRNRALVRLPRKNSARPLGSKKTLKSGYVWIKTTDGWKNEHRVVMEERLGRSLWPDENVHHKNGNRADNRLENLELWSTSQPCGQRVEDKLEWAVEMIKRYDPDLLK